MTVKLGVWVSNTKSRRAQLTERRHAALAEPRVGLARVPAVQARR